MNESRLLTQSERERFVRWLRDEAHSSKILADQAGKLPGMEALAKRLRAEAMAAEVVASKLESTSEEVIG
jgi:hypothetical protein